MQQRIEADFPSWSSVRVTRHLPEALSGLERLCGNLWWCWNDNAKALFKYIDPDIWHRSGHNPMVILDTVSLKRYNQLAKDADFVRDLGAVMNEFDGYMARKADRGTPSIGYFCMEYGLDASLQIYSGGLGILAGDYLKESSDMNVNMVAVGLLYRYGYFTQRLTPQGNQVAEYNAQDFLKIPAEPVTDESGNWITISMQMPGREMRARIWKVCVGRTDLYLLDTDFEDNIPEDREVTYQLYGGSWENRLKQEILLGIGGIRALRAMGIRPDIYHCNEGHAAFIGLERLREYMQENGLVYEEAMELVRASGLFTTHTPVPAGHDTFEETMLSKYLGHYPARFGIEWQTFLEMGKINPSDPGERFSMSVLAANCSQNVNGVSMLHGAVSREILANMYKGYLPEELSKIGYVTNGVHYNTWASKEWKQIHYRVFGPEFITHHYDKRCFEGIYTVSDEEVWNTHQILKRELIRIIGDRLSDPDLSSHYSPSQVVEIKERLREDVLTIGFARRFATYKRATLLFTDLDRLDSIVNDPQHPVQFIFAGKAHPADGAGQDLIKRIIEISKEPRFLGRIIFVPGYDISLAKRLVQGVDVWMNNPTRPQEASGTSGEKAAMNGVMHFSVLDGWWVEGYKEGCGWALPQQRTYDDQRYQNQLDAATIYGILENEIAPLYYKREGGNGLSREWIGCIKNTIAKVACNFTTNRMMEDYCIQYYQPQYDRYLSLIADGFAKARAIAAWKNRVLAAWPSIKAVSYSPLAASYVLSNKTKLESTVQLDLAGLGSEDIGVELVLAVSDKKGVLHIRETFDYLPEAPAEDGTVTYRASILPDKTGMYQAGVRIYPRNAELPSRQDFQLVKWL